MISVGLAMLNNSGLRKMLHCLLIITVLLLSFSTIIQFTPLIVSSARGHSQVVKQLLLQPEIVIDARSSVC